MGADRGARGNLRAPKLFWRATPCKHGKQAYIGNMQPRDRARS
ncbi:hypothetical protein RCKEMMY_30 [Rhodobacter phage RcKemmy]|nr:hypothetical protein RCKEMMY_30 [Rhodobacter phage RcKemmy]